MTKTLLLSGQSNAVGRGEGGVFPSHSLVQVWDSQNDRDDLTALGTGFVTANRQSAPFVDSCNNLGYHAARYLADMIGEDVQLVIVAKGSQSISKWANGAPMHERIKAVLSAAGISAVDAFLWHQGEGDEVLGSGTYAEKFTQLLTDLESEGIVGATTPVIIGETSPTHPNINAVLRGLEGGRVRCARLTHLNTLSDGTHFDGSALVQAGWQYAKCLHDFFLTPWGPSMGEYVSAFGFQAQTLSSGADTKIPVQAFAGDGSWIVNGSFKAKKAGLYHFSARGYLDGGRLRLKLLDASGAELQFLAYSGGQDDAANNAIICGFADIDLAEGDIVSLGLTHSKGAAVSLTATAAAKHCRLSVRLMEEYA